MVDLDYSLYLVTDRGLLEGRDLIQEVKKAVNGGVSLVQLREKEADSREFYELALALKKELAARRVPLIINDRLDIAMAIEADGLHIGQEDLPLSAVRRITGPGFIVGISVGNLEQARRAEKDGASYLGAGPVFLTATKADAGEATGPEFIRVLKRECALPVIAIGGINEDNLAGIKAAGADGAAVVSALMGQNDIEAAARRLRDLWEKT